MKNPLLLAVFVSLLSPLLANAQVTLFPYNYDWTSPTAFVKQPDGRTYIGGDGNWRTYIVGGKSQWITDAGAGKVKTNSDNTDDTLLVLADALGLSFTGAETFAFTAAREGGGGPNGTMMVVAGTTANVYQVATDMSSTSKLFFVSLPAMLGNSIFSVRIIVHSSKQVTVDNTALFGGALPIQVSSFTASATGTGTVKLMWTTSSETNNYGFQVEKDTARAIHRFKTVPDGFIPGHGTTAIPQQYSFTDYNAKPGEWYYRLKQIDLDGTTHEGEATRVLTAVEKRSRFALGQNYPNPFNPSTTIRYDLPQSSMVRLSVFDILGHEISVLVNERKDAGSYEVKFDGSGLSSGVYFYRLQAGAFVQTRKLLLMK